MIALASRFATLIEGAKNGTSVQKKKDVRTLRYMVKNNDKNNDITKHAIRQEEGIPPFVEILKNGLRRGR